MGFGWTITESRKEVTKPQPTTKTKRRVIHKKINKFGLKFLEILKKELESAVTRKALIQI
jgi:hypothetical protein